MLTLQRRETLGFPNPPPCPHKANVILCTHKQTALLYTTLISYHKQPHKLYHINETNGRFGTNHLFTQIPVSSQY